MAAAPVSLLAVAVSLLLGSSLGHSSHSLRYIYTSVSEPGQQVPQFFSVGYVDDQQIVYYDANTRRYHPKAPWITKVDKDDPQYWEWNTQRAWNAEEVFRVDLVNVPRYYNQSGALLNRAQTAQGAMGEAKGLGGMEAPSPIPRAEECLSD